MRKLLLVMIGLVLLVLTACGENGDSKNDSDEGGASSKGDVTLRYAIWNQGQVKPMQMVIDEFEEANPGIKVKLETTPYKEYFTKLDAAATGDKLPDVFWMNPLNLDKYVGNDMVQNLTERIEEGEIDLENYPEGITNLYDVEGQQYGIPKDFDSSVLVYNKEMFDDAGIDYPDNSWDWDDFVDAAKALTDEDNGIYGFAAYNDDQTYYFNTVMANEGFIISEDKKTSGYDDPNTIEGIKKLWEMLHVHSVSPTFEHMIDNSPKDLFVSGQVAMIFDGTWNLIEYAENEYTKERVDISVLPSLAKHAAVTNGLGYMLSNQTDNPEEAWKFIEFLGSKRGNEIIAKHGDAIPAYIGSEDNWKESMSVYDNIDAVFEMVEVSEPFPVSKNTTAWLDIATTEFSKAWQGDISVEEAAKTVAEEMEEILSKE